MPRSVNLSHSGVAALLTTTSHVLQRLPGLVVEHQRADLARALSEAGDGLVVEIHCGLAVMLIRSGDRALVKIPAARRRKQPSGSTGTAIRAVVP